MGALDQVKSYFTGDVKIDDPEIRQALKNAFPNLARAGSEFDDLEYLPSAYVQEKIVPALMTMDEAHLQAFKAATQKTSGELHSLTTDIEQTLRYKPKDGNALPVDQRVPDKIKSAGKTIFKSAQDFISDTMNLRTDVEKEQTLLAEVIASANRATIKFDQYVMRGGGTQYGDKANEWTEIDSLHRNISRPATDKEISHDVENVAKADFVNMTNSVVAMAQDTSPYVTLDGKAQLVGNGTRLDKLAYLASWMSALEEGCDSVLPGIVAQTANKAVKIGIDSTVGVAADFVGGIWDDYPKMTVTIAALAGYAAYKTGGLVKGVLSVGGVPFKLAAKAASVFPMTKGAAPVLNRIGETLSFADKADATGEGGTSVPESKDKTVTIKGKEYYNPKSDSYKELETSVRSEIEKLKNPSTGTAAISEAEANTRLAKALRFLEGYKTDFLNGHAPYDKTEFGVKLNKIVKGETIIIPTEGTLRERVLGTAKKVATSPLKSAKEAKALVGEGISGKGWNLSARMAAITSAENLTAGSKNEPFKIEGVTDGYTFKGDHARVSAEMKEIDNLLKERAAVEKWIELEGKITAQQKIIDEMTKRANDLKAASSYFRTTSQTTSQPTNNGIANQTNTNQDLTDAAKQVEDAITKATEEKARLQASAGNSTEYKRVFIDKPKYTVSGGVQQQVGVTTSLEQANREFARISREITAKVNSSYNTAHGVTTGNPNKFRENERGININKFLKIIAESMSKK